MYNILTLLYCSNIQTRMIILSNPICPKLIKNSEENDFSHFFVNIIFPINFLLYRRA